MARPRILICVCGILLWLVACGNPPGLEAGSVLSASDQEVVLLPLDELLVQAGETTANDTSANTLAARAARLRARAAGI